MTMKTNDTVLKALLLLFTAVTAQHTVHPSNTISPSAHLDDFDLETTVYVYPDKTAHFDQYQFVDAPLSDHNSAQGRFDWDINLTNPLQIISNETPITYDDFYEIRNISDMFQDVQEKQGEFIMLTNYSMHHRHYSIEVFKSDCETAISPYNPFSTPVVTNDVDNTTGINDIAAYFFYSQGVIQGTDVWTANKTGGVAQFCVKLTNYLAEVKTDDEDDVFDEWGLPVSFNETIYTISVDSLTDFEATIDVERTGPEEGFDFIDFEENINAYACDDYYNPVSLTYSQGDFVNICVETISGSKFEVHSIKDLAVSQVNSTDNTLLLGYNYVDNFIDSSLSSSSCIDSNTTSAVCKTKVQLIAGYFIQESINAADGELDVAGSVKLDYLGRRLSTNLNLRLGSGVSDDVSKKNSRSLDAQDETSSKTFDMTITINASGDENSDFFSRDMTFNTVMSVIACFVMFLL